MITNTYYHYCSNLVYNNDWLSTILFDGGYASVDEGNGNIEEVNHYYPFGALMGDRCGVSRNKQVHKQGTRYDVWIETCRIMKQDGMIRYWAGGWLQTLCRKNML